MEHHASVGEALGAGAAGSVAAFLKEVLNDPSGCSLPTGYVLSVAFYAARMSSSMDGHEAVGLGEL
jgi:hypothetical protein